MQVPDMVFVSEKHRGSCLARCEVARLVFEVQSRPQIWLQGMVPCVADPQTDKKGRAEKMAAEELQYLGQKQGMRGRFCNQHDAVTVGAEVKD